LFELEQIKVPTSVASDQFVIVDEGTAVGHAIFTLEGHSDSVNGVAVTADGKRAVSASRDNTLKVWDLDSGRALCTLEGHSDSTATVAISSPRSLATL
jgi:WD40 repeat protein